MLVSLALGDANFRVFPHAKPKSCVLPDAKPKRKPVEYRLCWVPTQNSGVGHVHFTFLCVNFIPVGSRFSEEYGLYASLVVIHIEKSQLVISLQSAKRELSASKKKKYFRDQN